MPLKTVIRVQTGVRLEGKSPFSAEMLRKVKVLRRVHERDLGAADARALREADDPG
jgi:hypothetical protein